ncbi:MAG: hypothetical protein O3B01_17495 [Planctomycetota bacterium]|nr:hypothetical protein [Planctomycetota bacterium]
MTIVEIDDIHAEIIVVGVVSIIDSAIGVFVLPDTSRVGWIECLCGIAQGLGTETLSFEVCTFSEVSIRRSIIEILKILYINVSAWAFEKVVFLNEACEWAKVTQRLLRVTQKG